MTTEQLYQQKRMDVRRQIQKKFLEYLWEDTEQDIWEAVTRSLPSFRGDSDLSTWLFRLVKNQIINVIRREKRREVMPPSEVSPVLHSRQVKQMGSYAEFMWLLSLAAPQNREVIYKRFHDGYKMKELAQDTGQSYATIHMRYRHGIKQIRNKLERIEKC